MYRRVWFQVTLCPRWRQYRHGARNRVSGKALRHGPEIDSVLPGGGRLQIVYQFLNIQRRMPPKQKNERNFLRRLILPEYI
jgi:hypothetical protein